MATLTRTNSRNNKTEYKEYVNFLGNYKNGKKDNDDQISIQTETADIGCGISVKSFPLSNSSNSTSSSSLNSDLSEISKSSCTSYNNYMESYKNKKFQSVKPNFNENAFFQTNPTPINNKNNNKTVRTEIFIEVAAPIPKNSTTVSEVSKKFELNCKIQKNASNQAKSVKVLNKVHHFENKPPKIGEKPVITKLSQNLRSKNEEISTIPPPPPMLSVNNTKNCIPQPPPPPPPMNNPVNKAKVFKAPTPKNDSNNLKIKSTSPNTQALNGSIIINNNNNKNNTQPIDKNNPLVRKLVYGTLRGMYAAHHEKANDFVATLPRNMVKKNNGIQNIINTIAQLQSKLPGAGPDSSTLGGPCFASSPTPFPIGYNSIVIDQELPEGKMDPPPCVQNAMMKQTKKPFTYTPGGIDLSEIKSPRMQRRIERNANYEGAPELPRQVPQQNHGPLPPSALAAMQPQLQVQVFPSGVPPPPPGAKGCPPPPPPPPANIPPPPPLQPLPTQKVVTGDNQVLERPDMTKIIPENPMSLLKKTGGPKPRKSFVEEMYNLPQSPPVQQQRTPPVQPPQPQFQQKSPPMQQQWSPPVQQAQQPWSPQVQQSQQQWSPPVQQSQQPRTPITPQNQQQQQSPMPWRQQQRSPPIQQQQQQRSPFVQDQPAKYQPPIIERKESKGQGDAQSRYQPNIIQRNGQPPQKQDQPFKTNTTANLGSLYIPPNQQQQKSNTPPSPPERHAQSPKIQSPSTPTLKEAPKPWQVTKPQQPELPPWAKREPANPPINDQAQDVQSPPQTVPQRFVQNQPRSRPVSVHMEFQVNPNQQQNQGAPNAVYITQPVILQHPGGQVPQNNQMNRQINVQGAKVIPVQVQLGNKPTTPGNDKSFNRQQSWNNNPTQSNSFKIIQKITQTDDDEVDGNEPVVECSPRYPQQFQQAVPAEQLRKLKMSEGDRNLVNRFKQDLHLNDEEENPRYRGGHIPSKVFRILDELGVDDDSSLHNEVDPRYRGSAIPSKAFKFLQSMTDGNSDISSTSGSPVSRGSSGSGNKTPQVRTIPIQIEGNEPSQPYVHPSQQTVPEPKKYTGSSIPSRSFKILQAMTAPDTCANANEVNENIENYDPSSYTQLGFVDPNYPHPIPPYWNDYNYYYANPQTKVDENDNPRQTPIPFWGYYPHPYPLIQKTESDAETSTSSRATPVPFWGYYPYYAPNYTIPNEASEETNKNYPNYPYWDPYYYHYYYGYPLVYPPYFYEEESTNNENQSTVQENNIEQITEKEENKESEDDSNSTSSISSSEDEENEENKESNRNQNYLKTIKSVQDIKIYDNSDGEECYIEEQDDENVEDDQVSVYVIDDDSGPHELSTIYEESERSEIRESSVLSDTTTIAENEDQPKSGMEENKLCGEPKVDKTINNRNEVVEEEKSNEEDWWGILNKNDDYPLIKQSPIRDPIEVTHKEENENQVDKEDFWAVIQNHDDKASLTSDDTSSTSSSDSSSCKSTKVLNEETANNEEFSSESDNEKIENSNKENEVNNNIETAPQEPLSIKDRIKALKESIRQKQNKLKEEAEVKVCVREKVSAIEVGTLQSSRSKTTSTKSSLRSFEEYSEEEGDSGVTSDISRHISDSEEFPELKKMTRYQRAATHSRLFKLLQDECDENDEIEEDKLEFEEKVDKFSKLSVRIREEPKSRDHLSLPLNPPSKNSNPESGINSPNSPVNDKLASELVQSMLKRRKGQVFRNLSKEKLHAAAKRILQEDMEDSISTPEDCSSFLSPLRNSTESSTPAQTPQEFYNYNEYKQYYDTFKEAEVLYEESYDILPSKAFKLLQEHSGLNKTGVITGLSAKCPTMNNHPQNPTSPNKIPDPNEVTSAS